MKSIHFIIASTKLQSSSQIAISCNMSSPAEYSLSLNRSFFTPLWVHKIVAYWGQGTQINSPVRSNPTTDGIVFRGRGHRLGGSQTNRAGNSQAQQQTESNNASPQQRNQGDGIAFRGRSYRLNG
ncbi:hypothetical protein K1719_036663 [Acacia pycnantha]|nr:hypothetical protein K1719_036663 [Acacia pycnantha]